MLPPGTHSAIVAAQASAHLSHGGAHAAVEASTHYFRNAAVLELADRFMGDISDDFATLLKLNSTARRVMMSAASQRHAIERRAISSSLDAELVAAHIAAALANVRYIVQPRRDERVYELVGDIPPTDRRLLVALKLVTGATSASGTDELWIRTAHPLGMKNLRRRLAKGTLKALHCGGDA